MEPLSEPDATSSLRSAPDDKWVKPNLGDDDGFDDDMIMIMIVCDEDVTSKMLQMQIITEGDAMDGNRGDIYK